MDSVPFLATLLVLTACCHRPMQPCPEGSEPLGAEPVQTTTVAEYDRSEWGRWIDADEDCQDTRQEVLAAESTEPVTWDERGCRVLTGRWKCPYTGQIFTDPGLLDIDHTVALREAHVSGGWNWSKEKKRDYFNDLTIPESLVAVDRSANRSKGSRTPVDWLPENVAYRCTYLKNWVALKRHWGLDMPCAEAAVVARLMADHCP